VVAIYKIGLQFKRNLGAGEISCLAYAYENRFAILTDDQQARKVAKEKSICAQTSPHLLGWLV
jgi:predicted nucleic acid-binding protein